SPFVETVLNSSGAGLAIDRLLVLQIPVSDRIQIALLVMFIGDSGVAVRMEGRFPVGVEVSLFHLVAPRIELSCPFRYPMGISNRFTIRVEESPFRNLPDRVVFLRENGDPFVIGGQLPVQAPMLNLHPIASVIIVIPESCDSR